MSAFEDVAGFGFERRDLTHRIAAVPYKSLFL
jgi:hypothetical protein